MESILHVDDLYSILNQVGISQIHLHLMLHTHMDTTNANPVLLKIVLDCHQDDESSNYRQA